MLLGLKFVSLKIFIRTIEGIVELISGPFRIFALNQTQLNCDGIAKSKA